MRFVAVRILDPDQSSVLFEIVAGSRGEDLENEFVVALILDCCNGIVVGE